VQDVALSLVTEVGEQDTLVDVESAAAVVVNVYGGIWVPSLTAPWHSSGSLEPFSHTAKMKSPLCGACRVT
jgi:hypothetical protein